MMRDAPAPAKSFASCGRPNEGEGGGGGEEVDNKMIQRSKMRRRGGERTGKIKRDEMPATLPTLSLAQ